MRQTLWRICLILIVLLAPHVQAQDLCRHGLYYLRDNGQKLYVVTAVAPYSPAERAGIHVGDQIRSVEGFSTQELSPLQLDQLLEQPQSAVLLSLYRPQGRLEYQTALRKECLPADSYTERELAQAFALYSTEDAHRLHIGYPYTYYLDERSNPSSWSAYSLPTPSGQHLDTDKVINQYIQQALSTSGLHHADTELADINLQTYYSISPIEQTLSGQVATPSYSWRWDEEKQTLTPLPVLPISSASTSGIYLLELGIEAYSRSSKRKVWSCEARELLSEGISMTEYARTAIPMMLRHFPHLFSSSHPTYEAEVLRYNYTGIIYASETLSHVRDVEPESPAYKAGIRPGDQIRKINGIRLVGRSVADINERYRDFVQSSALYRDKSSSSISGQFWLAESYRSIQELTTKEKYAQPFVYLFFFRPYINDSTYKTLIFEIERAGQIYTVALEPEYRDETRLRILPS